MSKHPELLKDFFKTNDDGLPLARFKIQVKEDARRSIVNPDHSALVITHLRRIDTTVRQMLDLITTPEITGDEANQIIAEAEALCRHGNKILAQAFYLDTADRNSWQSINQVCTPGNGLELMPCAPKLLDYVRFFPDLERYAERKFGGGDNTPTP